MTTPMTNDALVSEALSAYERKLPNDPTPRQADSIIPEVVADVLHSNGLPEDGDEAELLRTALCEKAAEVAPGEGW